MIKNNKNEQKTRIFVCSKEKSGAFYCAKDKDIVTPSKEEFIWAAKQFKSKRRISDTITEMVIIAKHINQKKD